MTISRTIRFMGFALIAIAAIPLYLTEAMPSLFWLVAPTGLIMGVMIGSNTFSKKTESIFRILVVTTLLIIVFTGFQKENLLLYSINFLFLITIIRGMRLRTSRHYFQFIGLSFLILSASAIVNLDIAFAIVFIVYAIFLTWTLVYTHIFQQVESSSQYNSVSQKASQFISAKFLLGSSVLGFVLLISSLAVFFFFPRFTLGFFASGKDGETVQGFSDVIDLGHFGTMKTSERVVLRLEFLSGKENINPERSLYLRGISFDKYDGKTWSKSRKDWEQRFLMPLTRRIKNGYLSIPQQINTSSIDFPELEYNIYQEPLNNEMAVIFVATKAVAIKPQNSRFSQRQRKTTFFMDYLHNLTHDKENNISLDYTGRSEVFNHAVMNLDQAETLYPRSLKDRFTQLPLDIDKRIFELAKEYSQDTDNIYASVLSIQNSLIANYGYTTEGVGHLTDPIANFLFERKEGHCEYFSTAMVLMLRSLGIPARPVNGFLGSQYNSYGDYYIIKEANAHTWVEVFFPGHGWLIFDPTPPTGTRAFIFAAFTQLRLLFDSLKLQWYKWVVLYNMDRQLIFYAGVWNALIPDSQNIDLSKGVSARDLGRKIRSTVRGVTNWETAVILITLIGFVPGSRFLYRVYRKNKHLNSSYLVLVSHKLKVILARKGFYLTPGLTLPAIASKASEKKFSARSELMEVVDLLEEGRWNPLAKPQNERIRRLLKIVSKGDQIN